MRTALSHRTADAAAQHGNTQQVQACLFVPVCHSWQHAHLQHLHDLCQLQLPHWQLAWRLWWQQLALLPAAQHALLQAAAPDADHHVSAAPRTCSQHNHSSQLRLTRRHQCTESAARTDCVAYRLQDHSNVVVPKADVCILWPVLQRTVVHVLCSARDPAALRSALRHSTRAPFRLSACSAGLQAVAIALASTAAAPYLQTPGVLPVLCSAPQSACDNNRDQLSRITSQALHPVVCTAASKYCRCV